MRKGTLLLTLLFLLTLGLVVNVASVSAKDACDGDDLEKCEKEIEKYEKKYESTNQKLEQVRNQKNSINSQIQTLSTQSYITQSQINEIQAQIDEVEELLVSINENLEIRRTNLSEKIDLRNTVVRNYSKRSSFTDLEMFMNSLPASNTMNGFQLSMFYDVFKKAVSDEALKVIDLLSGEIKNFEDDKADAESLKADLEDSNRQMVQLQAQLANQLASAKNQEQELSEKEEDYSEELSSLNDKINELNEKQRQILAAKAGEGTSSLGEYQSPKWKVPSPKSKPAFGAFSYGAFTHYNGMSQYGAKGRADEGQSWEQILKHYYGDLKLDKDYKEPSTIRVKGKGVDCNNNPKTYDEEVDFQKYLKRIYEMPGSWNKNALKVQAIAARTYAIRINNAKGFIEPNQSNQVYKNCDNVSGWVKAVEETKGYVLLKDGKPALTEYSSTTGGYLNQSGWDTKGSWPEKAYEYIAGSPWFYWAWYSQSYRFDSNTCGRDTPWLSESEMVDILNAWVLFRHGDTKRVTPVSTSCWGGDPYSHKELAARAESKYNEKYTSISSVSSDVGSNGRTSKVTFNTNRGKVTIDGEEFKTVFNLRAPAYVAIRSRLYEIKMEK